MATSGGGSPPTQAADGGNAAPPAPSAASAPSASPSATTPGSEPPHTAPKSAASPPPAAAAAPSAALTPTQQLVLRQLDYYFSDENLQRDGFLLQCMDVEGYVPLPMLATFNAIRTLTTDVRDVVAAAAASTQVELFTDEPSGSSFVRRKPVAAAAAAGGEATVSTASAVPLPASVHAMGVPGFYVPPGAVGAGASSFTAPPSPFMIPPGAHPRQPASLPISPITGAETYINPYNFMSAPVSPALTPQQQFFPAHAGMAFPFPPDGSFLPPGVGIGGVPGGHPHMQPHPHGMHRSGSGSPRYITPPPYLPHAMAMGGYLRSPFRQRTNSAGSSSHPSSRGNSRPASPTLSSVDEAGGLGGSPRRRVRTLSDGSSYRHLRNRVNKRRSVDPLIASLAAVNLNSDGQNPRARENLDLAIWMKSIRLHKYTELFLGTTREEMLAMTDEEWEQVEMTVGARKKLRLELERWSKEQESVMPRSISAPSSSRPSPRMPRRSSTSNMSRTHSGGSSTGSATTPRDDEPAPAPAGRSSSSRTSSVAAAAAAAAAKVKAQAAAAAAAAASSTSTPSAPSSSAQNGGPSSSSAATTPPPGAAP